MGEWSRDAGVRGIEIVSLLSGDHIIVGTVSLPDTIPGEA